MVVEAAVQSAAPSRVKFTVPPADTEGVPVVDTVAVKVTESPTVEVFAVLPLATVLVVVALFTTCEVEAEVLLL
jgi:hypothetical protein